MPSHCFDTAESRDAALRKLEEAAAANDQPEHFESEGEAGGDDGDVEFSDDDLPLDGTSPPSHHGKPARHNSNESSTAAVGTACATSLAGSRSRSKF
jgi:hypothetical protein